jgi:carbamoyltransferase
MKILAINFTHDSSVAYMEDGEITGYYKEERYTRNKRDSFPDFSIKKCLNNHPRPDFVLYHNMDYPEGHIILKSYLTKCVGVPADIMVDTSQNHHLAHAACAFYNSGFDKSLVFVVDGRGSLNQDFSTSECETIYSAEYPDKFEVLQKNTFRASYKPYMNREAKNTEIENFLEGVGGLVSKYNVSPLSFGQDLMENGKAMGLSAYGKTDLGNIDDDLGFSDYGMGPLVSLPIYLPYKNILTNKITESNYQPYADLALTVQKRTQEALRDMIKEQIKKTNIKKVCIAGGYGMNVVANKFLIDSFPDVEFFFEPLSDDSGIPIGMCKLFYHLNTKDDTVRPIKTTSIHGQLHDLSEVNGHIVTFKDIATLLSQNKSVAVFYGQAEAGQRALGNRSILFNALHPDAKNIVNVIKKREWYRPFACIILEEDADEYFDMGRIKSSPFMTIAFKAKVDIIPGVTHIDGTCRIQTISQEHHLYELLKEFKSITGHGILLNTSFNLAGEPLVESPQDALNTLEKSELDYVFFQDKMVLV